MVFKDPKYKQKDRMKSSSKLANKKAKRLYKGKRKDNYKKKTNNYKLVDCNICYNEVEDTSDNTICCGKAKHIVCSSCKIQMKNRDCPMCRSHNIKQPIAQNVYLPIYQKLKKPLVYI